MKKLLGLLLIVLLAGSIATAEAPLRLVAEMWVCGTCKRENTADVCEKDGTPRPADSWETRWKCPVCTGVAGGKFCENDAQPRTPACILKKGDIVTFGTYPVSADGAESAPIEWIVLKYTGTRVMLVSRYVLDSAPYDTEKPEKLTYENSSVRAWLNGAFPEKAFTPEDREFIAVSDIATGYGTGWYKWRTDPGEGTRDKVFLLSYQEAVSAFGTGEKARAQATPYAAAKAVWTNTDATGTVTALWWLRSPGEREGKAAAVNPKGELADEWAFFSFGGIRPAVSVSVTAAY